MRDIAEADVLALRKAWLEEARVQTPETFPAFMEKLTTFDHDYNTSCYAAGAIAVGAVWAANKKLGLTGFQGGAVMWEFMQGWGGIEPPARLIQYEHMLYPQYESKFEKIIGKDVWDILQTKAAELLKDRTNAHPTVFAHWKSVAAGNIPFGYKVGTN